MRILDLIGGNDRKRSRLRYPNTYPLKIDIPRKPYVMCEKSNKTGRRSWRIYVQNV